MYGQFSHQWGSCGSKFRNSNGVQEVDLDLYFLNKNGEISSRVQKGTHQV